MGVQKDQMPHGHHRCPAGCIGPRRASPGSRVRLWHQLPWAAHVSSSTHHRHHQLQRPLAASRSLDSGQPPPGGAVCGAWKWGPPLEGVRLTDRRREAITHQSLPPTPPACRAPTCFLLLLSLLQFRLLLSGGTPGPCRDPAVWGSFPGLGPFFLPVHDTCFRPEIRGSQERG